MSDIYDAYLDYMFHFNIFHLISIILCFFILFNRNLYSKDLNFLLTCRLRYIVAFYYLLFFSFPIYDIFLLGNFFITIFCPSICGFSYESYGTKQNKLIIYFNKRNWYFQSYIFSSVCIYLIALYVHFCGVILDDSYSSYLDVNFFAILFWTFTFSIPIGIVTYYFSTRDDK